MGGGCKKVSKSIKESTGACEFIDQREREEIFKHVIFFRLSVKCT